MNKRRLLLGLLRLVVFAGLLAFVVSRVQLRDRVVLGEAVAGEPRELVGTLVRASDEVVELRATDGRRFVIPVERLAEGSPELGLWTLLRGVDRGLFAAGFLAMIGTFLVTILRWQLLCRARAIDLGFREAFRLSFLGFFFNNFVPGATGGDVMKAVLASRDRGNKAEVFASVFIDRIIGLVALVFLAGGVLLVVSGDERFGLLAGNVFLLLGAMVIAGVVYYSRRLRRMLGLSYVGHRLPFRGLFHSVDRAFFLYRFHKPALGVAFAMSFAAHGFTISSHVLIGRALGLDVPLATYFVYIPIGQVLSAIPIFPGGWGVREAAYGSLFSRAGVSFSSGAALGILHGLVVTAWSLFGGVFFLLGHERLPSRTAGPVFPGSPPAKGSERASEAG